MKTQEEQLEEWRTACLLALRILRRYTDSFSDTSEVPPIIYEVIAALRNNPENPLQYVYQPYSSLPKTTPQ